MKLLSKKYFSNETKMEFIVIKLFSTIIPCCYGITSSVFKSMQGSWTHQENCSCGHENNMNGFIPSKFFLHEVAEERTCLF